MTNYLIKNITILDKTSDFNGKKVHLLIENGNVTKISEDFCKDTETAQIIDYNGCYLAPPFCDVYVHVGDPGFEYREDIQSVANAALFGGFTSICSIADNHPITQTKAQVEYIINQAKNTAIDIFPIGAITENFDGKTPTEMQDMHQAGAIAFSDAPHSIKDSGMLLRALQYVQPFEGLVITMPYDKSLVGDGQVNESEISVRMGMKGITNLSEYVSVQRDLEVLRYTGGKLHLVGISTAESVSLIRKAKVDGLQVTCSVFVHHLIGNENEVKNFDANYKVFPPLRTDNDKQALREGLIDGTIDTISTQHTPLSNDEKNVEFELAEFGMIGLETAFGLLNKNLGNQISKEKWVELLSVNPRKILGKPNRLEDFVILNFEEEYVFRENMIRSKSKNTPYLEHSLKGKVKAAFVKGKLYLN